MSKFLYGRKYRVLVAGKDNVALDVSNLRCTFHIEKTARALSNYAEISIYNLTSSTEMAIVKEGDRVIVEAGYDGFIDTETGQKTDTKQYGKIFDGDILQPLRDREDNVNYRLTLVCQDGEDFLNRSLVRKTIGAGLEQRQIINKIVSEAKTLTGIGRISSNLSTQKLPRGKVFFGTPKNYLSNIANDNGATFWVDDGQVNIAKATDVPVEEALVLTPQNGLIGTPQQTFGGITFKCLLNPSLKLMNMIKIDNSDIRRLKWTQEMKMTALDQDGQYQIYKMIYTGDTRGDEWYVDVEGISRNGLMPLPLMLDNATQNPF
ncbi:hypothetical protein SOV_04840 [Sporomusa ovata DSM 2662]|uniref:Phage protein n=1 Tax=Sporomusa ovata TaxID=2378 RepID=A0A0U1KW78_9FIRM|nr:hypothetical protein [Sporomusa ovata]EQB28154.1 hypothetical protein SOV_2c10770 [Sporomusa ovata DSM 2662]CQR71688.1 Phage protein [Sporomusa ovata]